MEAAHIITFAAYTSGITVLNMYIHHSHYGRFIGLHYLFICFHTFFVFIVIDKIERQNTNSPWPAGVYTPTSHGLLLGQAIRPAVSAFNVMLACLYYFI